jgi:ring-1,2-phenylacetyl-CoA epoxidase subunit PaaD
MGILREVRLAADDVVEAVITPTYSGCPAMDVIRLDVELALARADCAACRVISVLSPAWTTDWLTAAAREKLRANGIAPPAKASGKRALFADEDVACPKCGSGRTQKVSEFSSTACKAHWRCLACLEPFEHFKCI